MKKKMPKLKQEISTPWGKARVVGTDLFKETVTVELLDNEAVKEIALDELVPPEEKSHEEADGTQG